jgi:hypothetical protein
MARIDAWEAIGLVDHDTADRLRAAESDSPADDGEPRGPSAIAAFFGPSVSIAEALGYLGGAFLLAAWHNLVPGVGPGSLPAPALQANLLQYGLPALLLAALGLRASRGTDRQRRFAGVAYAVATWEVYEATRSVLEAGAGTGPRDLAAVAAAAIAALTALAFRRSHPAVVTQLGLLAALAWFATRLLDLLVARSLPGGVDGGLEPGAVQIRVAAGILWWLGWAIAFGVLARREARQIEAAAARRAGLDDQLPLGPGHARDLVHEAGQRRVAVTRLAAGLAAVLGITTSVTQGYGFAGAIQPWIGDAVILGVAVGLLAIALRPGSGPYLYPAALGIIVGLTDINARYIAERMSVGFALLVEGLILIGAGLLAERLRRRIEAARNVAPDSMAVVPSEVKADGAPVTPAETAAPAMMPALVEAAVDSATMAPGSVEEPTAIPPIVPPAGMPPPAPEAPA